MIEHALIENYNKTRPYPAADRFCYAPFSSLYFGHEGKVTACCENREHLLGTYPQQSISEIWNGEAADQLRQYITEQNLWHGCKGCDFDLRSGNFGGVHARIFDTPRLHQRNPAYPAMLEFELENTCNLECVMCTGIFSSSIRKNREHLPPILSPYDAAFVKQLEEFIPHLSLASFFGGEPFLAETYYSIWERMAELNPGMHIWVTTNSTILNNRVKNLLNKLKFNLTFSIDSLQKETYEKIRVNASFGRVMENLEYFIAYTKTAATDCTINTCPMPVNWRELPDIVQWGNEKKITVNIIPVRHPENSSLRSLPSETLKEIIAHYRGFTFSATDKYSSTNKKNYEDYIRLVEHWLFYREELERSKSAVNGADPLAEIKKRIAAGLTFSSSTIESKEERINAAMQKISGIQQKLESIDPELGNAVWGMAMQSNIEQMLYALFAWGEDELLKQGKDGIAGVIDGMQDGSPESTHLKRLKLYLEYLELTGTSAELSQAALNRWKNTLSSLAEEQKQETVVMLNEQPIATFAEALLKGEEEALLSWRA